MSELFHLSGFGFTYPQQRTPALTDVELTIRSQKLLLAAGKLLHRLVEPVLNAEIACHFPDAAADHLGRKSQILQAERQLMPNLVCNVWRYYRSRI